MPSGLRKTTGNHFEIYYEEPWGGVASNKSPVDIDPNQCVTQDGVVLRNGLMCYSNIASQNSKWDLELIPPNTPPSDPPVETILTEISFIISNFLGNLVSRGAYGTGTFTVPDTSIFIVGQTFLVTYTPTGVPGPITLIQVVTAITSPTVFVSGVFVPATMYTPYGVCLDGNPGGTTPAITGASITYFTQNFSIPTTPTNNTFAITSVTPSILVGSTYALLEVIIPVLPTHFYFGMVFNYVSGTEVALNGTYVIYRVSGSTYIATCSLPSTAIADTGGVGSFFDVSIPFPIIPANYWVDAVACLIFNCANYLCAVDQYGNAYIATLQTDGTIKFQFDRSEIGRAHV